MRKVLITIQGIAGPGKTVCANAIIEALEKNLNFADTTIVFEDESRLQKGGLTKAESSALIVIKTKEGTPYHYAFGNAP
jgi:thymidylate kinase